MNPSLRRLAPWRSLLVLAAAVAGLASRVAVGDEKPIPDALTTDPSGWEDVMPSPDLKDWSDVPIPSESKVTRAQWHVVNGQLVCDGDGGHDMLMLDWTLRDCIFHVEFMLKPLPGNPPYNSGVFIRTTHDGDFWNQAQVGALSGGYWFGSTPDAAGKPKSYNLQSQTTCHVKAVGEWNTFEVTAKGRVLSLLVNGFPATSFNDCGVDMGYVALEGEHFPITFRNLKLKILP